MALPEQPLVTTVVQLAVMQGAERHRPFIAGLEPAGTWLNISEVMGLGGLTAADQAGLRGDDAEVVLVANPLLRLAKSPGGGILPRSSIISLLRSRPNSMTSRTSSFGAPTRLRQLAGLTGYMKRGLQHALRHGIISAIRHGQDTAAVRRALRLRDSGQRAEYKAAVAALNFDVFDASRPVHLHDMMATEREAFCDVTDIAAQSPESVAQLCRAVEYVIANNIPGDFVECGVYKGASPYVITRTLMEHGVKNRKVWLYDTFEGFPEPDPELDIHFAPRNRGDYFHDEWERTRLASNGQASDFMRSPLNMTRRFVTRSNYPEEQFEFVKGLVEDTIPDRMPKKISLLRLDTDFYSSIRHELIHLYPRLVRGGILILDDYGALVGAKKAVDEYFKEHNEPMCLFRIDEHVRAGIKVTG